MVLALKLKMILGGIVGAGALDWPGRCSAIVMSRTAFALADSQLGLKRISFWECEVSARTSSEFELSGRANTDRTGTKHMSGRLEFMNWAYLLGLTANYYSAKHATSGMVMAIQEPTVLASVNCT